MDRILAVPLLGLLAGVPTTLAIRWLAHRHGLVDHPDRRRKVHQRAVPLGGGVAVLVAAIAGLLTAAAASAHCRQALLQSRAELFGLLIAATAICLVGLADDRFNLRGRHKLLGQMLAVAILLASGLVIRNIRLFHWHLDLGLLAVPFTAFWLLGAVNALNFIDGIDGLAASVGIILCVAIAAMAHHTGRVSEEMVALALAGSLVGFLCFNFPPASIFLGDAGSMMIGLVAGALAIQAGLKGPATVALAAPLAVWSIPVFDCAVAILRRKLTGRSIYTTDRSHLHHCLLRRGLTGLQAVAGISLLCAATAAGALATVYLQNELFAGLSVLAVVGVLVCTRTFGYVELRMLKQRVKGTAGSFLRPLRTGSDLPAAETATLQGSRRWERLWQLATDSAQECELRSILLDVNVPAIQEGFYARWQRADDGDDEERCWRTVIPLVANSQRVGRIELSGLRSSDGSAGDTFGQVAGLLDRLEFLLHQLLDGDGSAPPLGQTDGGGHVTQLRSSTVADTRGPPATGPPEETVELADAAGSSQSG